MASCTKATAPVVSVILKSAANVGVANKKNERKTALFIDVAERVGFEPTVELPPLRFSRPACSTAPAPLRKASGQQTNIVFCFRWSFREGKQMKRATKSATKLVVLDNNDPISKETEQLQSRIRDRAYQLSQE